MWIGGPHDFYNQVSQHILVLLLKQGAELECEDKGGRSSPWWAANNGHEAVVKLLLEKGAKDKARGQTPLWRATGNGREAL